jgi:hypothetical protein
LVGGTAWLVMSSKGKATLANVVSTDPIKGPANEALVKQLRRVNPITKEPLVADYVIVRWHEPIGDIRGSIKSDGHGQYRTVQEAGTAIQVDYRWCDRNGVWTDDGTVFVVRDGRVYDAIPAGNLRLRGETASDMDERVGHDKGHMRGLTLPSLPQR